MNIANVGHIVKRGLDWTCKIFKTRIRKCVKRGLKNDFNCHVCYTFDQVSRQFFYLVSFNKQQESNFFSPNCIRLPNQLRSACKTFSVFTIII